MELMSDFQYVGHSIAKMKLEFPVDTMLQKAETINYLASWHAEYSENRWHGAVTIGFQQLDGASENPSVLFEIVVVGRFISSGTDSEESRNEFVRFLKSSGAATLISIARAAIISAGALCGFPGLCTIPNINVYAMNWAEDMAPEQVQE